MNTYTFRSVPKEINTLELEMAVLINLDLLKESRAPITCFQYIDWSREARNPCCNLRQAHTITWHQMNGQQYLERMHTQFDWKESWAHIKRNCPRFIVQNSIIYSIRVGPLRHSHDVQNVINEMIYWDTARLCHLMLSTTIHFSSMPLMSVRMSIREIPVRLYCCCKQ